MRKLLLIIVILIPSFCSADLHYVSKSGTSEDPYTSWETAADSIQKAIDAAEAGDTVRVGAGTYLENIVTKGDVPLIGAGMDSTIIQGVGEVRDVVYCNGTTSISGFHIIGERSGYNNSVGIFTENPSVTLTSIFHNRISNCYYAMALGKETSQVYANEIINNENGILTGWVGHHTIRGNIMSNYRGEISCLLGTRIIENNIIVGNFRRVGIEVDETDSAVVRNNIVSTAREIARYGIFLDPLQGRSGVIENNTIVGPGWGEQFWLFAGIQVSESVYVRNNIAVNCKDGIRYGTPGFMSYNDSWNNEVNFFHVTPGEGDMSLDPMFFDSLDFHLQKFSPCIDAGVPEILDKDSTRSDMGAYGGPGSESYFYQDLPPKAPDTLMAEILPDSSTVFLDWKDNAESDLFGYLIYRDTLEGFIPDTFKVIDFVSKDTSFYYDYDIELGYNYYYRVRAYDSALQGGEYSEEVKVVLTGIEEEQKEVPFSFKLYQNYPNPFNSTTTIPFRVHGKQKTENAPIRTSLKIYNIRGELVRTLWEGNLTEGDYKVIWDGRNNGGRRVSSGVYFYLLKAGDNKKVKSMVYLK